MDVSSVETLCLTLGPYRNLSTLTGSIMFLHPHCQVLNHGGIRIFNDERIDFIAQYSDATFKRYLQYGIHISQAGTRGNYGGSILNSHAFDTQHETGDIYSEAYESTAVKKHIKCFYWKEPLLIANHLRDNDMRVADLLQSNPKIRFLIPVRNPIDCAISTKKSEHYRFWKDLPHPPDTWQILDAILDEYVWTLQQLVDYPEHHVFFFEYEFSEDTLQQIARLVQLEPDNKWIEHALAIYNIKPSYDHSNETIAYYNQQVKTKFAAFPDFAAKLLHFTDDQ